MKADVTTVEAVQRVLATKADKLTTYNQTETYALLIARANASDVSTALNLKSDKTTVASSLALNADVGYIDDNSLL